MACCICSHDVRLVDGLLQLHCPFYFSLSSSQPASLRYYCIKKTNRVAAKFRYKAKDVGQPPWLGCQGCQGDGEGKRRLDKGQAGQGAVLNACQMRTKDPFFYGRTITRRSSRAHKNNAAHVARGANGGRRWETGEMFTLLTHN